MSDGRRRMKSLESSFAPSPTMKFWFIPSVKSPQAITGTNVSSSTSSKSSVSSSSVTVSSFTSLSDTSSSVRFSSVVSLSVTVSLSFFVFFVSLPHETAKTRETIIIAKIIFFITPRLKN